MPFSRPSPFDIRDRLAAELAVLLPGADARMRRSVEELLVRMVAMASHELHGHLAWIALQILPLTADSDILARHAAVWGVERIAATPARGAVTFSGSAGAIVPAGTELRRGDDARYLVDADVAIGGGGTGTGDVTALAAGAEGNAATGVTVSLIAPVAGVVPSAVVAAGGLEAGAPVETDERLRARLLARIQEPPAGGARHDYQAWALAVAGVEQAWVYPSWLGAGTVGVAILAEGGAIPGGPLVAAVQAWIDDRRPVTADVTVFAPATEALDVTIALNPDTVAVRTAVLAELQDFLRREADPGGTLRMSRLSAAISAAAGEASHVLSDPSADLVLPSGTIAVLGTVTWV